jgi:hypothetical protein
MPRCSYLRGAGRLAGVRQVVAAVERDVGREDDGLWQGRLLLSTGSFSKLAPRHKGYAERNVASLSWLRKGRGVSTGMASR